MYIILFSAVIDNYITLSFWKALRMSCYKSSILAGAV